nr:MAG: capsid protein [Cressdnaviricota sp.]
MVIRNILRHYARRALRHGSRAGARVAGAAVAGTVIKKLAGSKSKSHNRRKVVTGHKGRFIRKEIGFEQVSHSGIATTTIKIKGGKAKLLKKQKKMGNWKNYNSYPFLLQSSVGAQQFIEIGAVNTIDQMISSTTSPTIYQAPVCAEQMNPYLSNTGSVTLGTTVTPLEDRFVLKSNSIKMEFTNFEPVGAIIDVYICKAKKYVGSNLYPIASVNQGFINEAFGLPAAVQSNTTGNVGFTTGYGSTIIPDVKPTDSALFNSTYKVCAVRHLEMIGGATQDLNIEILDEKVIRRDIFAAQLAATFKLAPITYVVFVRIRGSLVLDIDTGFPTFGPTKVGCVWRAVTNSCAVFGGNDNRLSTNVFSANIPKGGVAADQKILNEVDAPTVGTVL